MKLVNALSPRNAPWLLASLTFGFYVVVPLVAHAFLVDDPYLLKLAGIATLAVVGMLVGTYAARRPPRSVQVFTPSRAATRSTTLFCVACLAIFGGVFLLLVVTADSVPILSALRGADADQLSSERGAFLKQREGALEALSYVFAMMISSVLPFCVVFLFEIRSRLRRPAALIVAVVCISVLVKAMFLNLILPLVAYAVLKGRVGMRALVVTIGLIVSGLALMVGLAGYNEDGSGSSAFDFTQYFSTGYASQSTLDFLMWRSLVIPVVSARDTLEVHEQRFGGRLLGGSTSGLVARFVGAERINMERLVFEHQYGGWSDIGNSNATFVTDAYINFGYAGVFLFGMVAALILRYLARGPTFAMASMTLLLVLFLVHASLIGVMLSNGFFVLLGWQIYLRATEARKRPASIRPSTVLP